MTNCSEVQGIGLLAVKCLIDDFVDQRQPTRELMARLWTMFQIWFLVYLGVAIPLWCTRGKFWVILVNEVKHWPKVAIDHVNQRRRKSREAPGCQEVRLKKEEAYAAVGTWLLAKDGYSRNLLDKLMCYFELYAANGKIILLSRIAKVVDSSFSISRELCKRCLNS